MTRPAVAVRVQGERDQVGNGNDKPAKNRPDRPDVKGYNHSSDEQEQPIAVINHKPRMAHEAG
jgi:hypothetical protein